MPVLSTMTALVMTRSGDPARDAGRLPHPVANDLAAAELRLVAVGRRVVLDPDDEIGVGQADAIAGRRAVVVGVGAAVDLHKTVSGADVKMAMAGPAASSRGVIVKRTVHEVVQAVDFARPPSRPGRPIASSPGSKRTAVPAAMFSRMPYAAARSNASQRFTSKK